MKTYIVDIDNTICHSNPGCDYSQCVPIQSVIDHLNQKFDEGNQIILFTARGMRTYAGNIKQINMCVKPTLIEWLKRHGVNYHRLIMGKPWGPNCIYVDDKAIRPDEFLYE